jgi:hypothetical protein
MDVLTGRHRIARWLKPLLEAEDADRPTVLAIRHISVNDRHADVITMAVPQAGGDDEEALPELAEQIENAIQSDADGLGATQRYLVVALRGDVQLTRLPFRVVAGSEGESGEPIDSEPATGKGLLAQLMRHNEAQSRMFMVSVGHILTAMQRTIAQQQAMIDSVGDQRLELYAATEGLLSQKHDRELATVEAQHRVNTRSAMMQKIINFVPLALSYLTPKEGENGVRPSQVGGLLRSFFETLDEQQFESLAKVLSEEQMMAVLAIVEKVKGEGGIEANGVSKGPPQ